MGTRGIVGFRIDGVDKLTYNHHDSYPEGLGETVVGFIRSVNDIKGFMNWDEVKDAARNLKGVSAKDTPTAEEVEKLKEYANLNVGNQNINDWYCLLRETQGDLEAILKSGYYVDQNMFILDSLFCEYGYIINLDDEVLEFYVGFQKAPHTKGRYGSETIDDGDGYYPCALVRTFPLANIPENWQELMNNAGEDETEEETVTITLKKSELQEIINALHILDFSKANNEDTVKNMINNFQNML